VLLLGVVDHSRLHETDDAVAQKLGMHSKVLLVHEIGNHGVGDQPVAHLDGGAVLYNAGHVSADALHNIRRGLDRVLKQRLVMGEQEVDILDIYESITVGAGHVLIHLSHHQLRLLHGGQDDVHAYPQAQVAVLVRKRGLDEGHVHRDQLSSEELGNEG